MARHFPSFAIVALFFACFWSRVVAQGVVNVTIDDWDDRNIYRPKDEWTSLRAKISSGRYQGTASYTHTLGATVSFTFTNTTKLYWIGYGNSVLSPALWPITLNDQTFEANGHRDVADREQAIIWISPDLNPATQYTITLMKTNATLDYDLNLDGWILTQPIPTAIVEEPVVEPPSGNNTGAKAAAVVGGVLGAIIFILAALFLCFFLKVRRSQHASPQTKEADNGTSQWNGTSSPATGFGHGQAVNTGATWFRPSPSPPTNDSSSGLVPFVLPPNVAIPHSPSTVESGTSSSPSSAHKPSAYRQLSTPSVSSTITPPISAASPAPAYIP